MKSSKPDLLDWTITDAPEGDEPPLPTLSPPASRPETRPRGVSRRISWIVAAFIVGVSLAVGLYSTWQTSRTRQAVRLVIALEERAALARDVERVRRLNVAGDASWLEAQTRLARAGQAAPLPLTMLRPVQAAGIVQSIEPFAPNVVQAEVTRRFAAPDGRVLAFRLPQFYRFDGEWKRIPPPAGYWGEAQTRVGPYASVHYYARDAAFVEAELGPYLDQMLTRVCQVWLCPSDTRLTISFTRHYLNLPRRERAADLPADEPLLFALLPPDPSLWATSTTPLYLPSPHEAGYPEDEAGADLLKRALAAQVLLETARQIPAGQSERPLSARNAFFYALVARAAIALKLDSTEPTRLRSLDHLPHIDALWFSRLTFRRDRADEARQALRAAWVILNWLLQDQPAGTENRLFLSLRSAASPVAWLSDGLDLSPDEAERRLQHALLGAVVSGLAEAYPGIDEADLQDALLGVVPGWEAAWPATFALGCRDGLALYSVGDAGVTYVARSRPRSRTYPVSWSPDGARLAAVINDQPVVIEWTTGAVTWFSESTQSYPWDWGQWVSDSVLTYLAYPPRSPSGSDLSLVTLSFFDAAAPQSQVEITPGISGYRLSPDRATAAVLIEGPERRLDLGVMPARGGVITPLDTHVTRPPRSDAFAAWSPDGRALVYGHFDEARNSFSLRVVDVATESIREITPEGSFGDRAQARSAYLDWSPTGEHIAFAVDYGAYRSWIGVVRPDGSDLKVLREHSATFYDLRFSADGQYLAATFYDFTESQKLVLYDAASGEERLFLPGVSHYDWSPTGHALVLASEAGLQLLAEPGDSQSEAEQLVDEPCSSVVWGPVP